MTEALAAANYRVTFEINHPLHEGQVSTDVDAYSEGDARLRVLHSRALYDVRITRVAMLGEPEVVTCSYTDDHGAGPGWTFYAFDEFGHRISGAVLICDVHGHPAQSAAYEQDDHYDGPCQRFPAPMPKSTQPDAAYLDPSVEPIRDEKKATRRQRLFGTASAVLILGITFLGATACGVPRSTPSTATTSTGIAMADTQAYSEIRKIPGVTDVGISYSDDAMAGAGFSGAVFASNGSDAAAIARQVAAILHAARAKSFVSVNVICNGVTTSTEQLGVQFP